MGGAEGNTGPLIPQMDTLPACLRGTGQDSWTSGETTTYRQIATAMVIWETDNDRVSGIGRDGYGLHLTLG